MTSVLIFLIRVYKLTISPILVFLFGNGCRFTPTCSNYTIEALERHGFLKGSQLSIKRFLRCHPFGGFGHDPVPTKI